MTIEVSIVFLYIDNFSSESCDRTVVGSRFIRVASRSGGYFCV